MDHLLAMEVTIIDKYVMVYAYVPEHILACHELSYLDNTCLKTFLCLLECVKKSV